MIDAPFMELTCERRPSKKDGKLRLIWQTKFQAQISKQGSNYVVGDNSLKANHQTMKRLAAVLVMFEERIKNEPIIEGTLASILILPEDLGEDGGRGLSRILQALKDSYREMHPRTWS